MSAINHHHALALILGALQFACAPDANPSIPDGGVLRPVLLGLTIADGQSTAPNIHKVRLTISKAPNGLSGWDDQNHATDSSVEVVLCTSQLILDERDLTLIPEYCVDQDPTTGELVRRPSSGDVSVSFQRPAAEWDMEILGIDVNGGPAFRKIVRFDSARITASDLSDGSAIPYLVDPATGTHSLAIEIRDRDYL